MKTSFLTTYWNSLKNFSSKTLVRNMMLVGFITLLVKVISFYKESLIASQFGLSELLDTYYLAILIPTFIQSVFIGSLKNLFIPNYINEKESGGSTASFQSYALLLIIIISVVLSILAILFTHFFLEMVFPGHDIDYYALIRSQFYIVLPCLLFWGGTGFLNGLQEIDNNYFISTITQVIIPVTIILCLLFLNNYFGDLVLVYGMLLGSIASFMFSLSFAIKDKLIQLGPLKLNDNIRTMKKQYLPKVTSGLLTGINPFIDQFFAAQLVIGSIAAINYGIKIPSFAVGILILAIGNVLLPHFSREINVSLLKSYKQLFRILKIVFSIGAVIAITAILLSQPIIRLLFERNEFTASDTLIVSKIQQITLVYVPFYLCTLVCVKFLTAINKNKFMAWISFWNLILNLVLNFTLVKVLGIYGLVLSTTIVYIICSIIYVGYTYNHYKKLKLMSA